MSLKEWVERLKRTLLASARTRTVVTAERREPGLGSDVAEHDLEDAERADRPRGVAATPRNEEGVRGERGIPSVNRARSMQARVTNALAIGLMLVLGLGFLSWYYATIFKRRADEAQLVKDAAASKASGEMKLPPLPPIELPRAADVRSAPPRDSLATQVLARAPDLPRRASATITERAAEAAAPLQPVGFTQPSLPPTAPQPAIQQPPPPSPEESATLRRLGSPVLYRAVDAGGAPVLSTAAAISPTQAGDGPSESSMPVLLGAGPSPGGGGGSQSLGGLLQATATPAVHAQTLPTRRLLLPKGAFIDCTLETALDSQLPGMTSCITALDIFGADGQVVLLERGSKLVGETRGETRLGQGRVFVLWTEARTPTGVVVQLASPGTDELGRSGLPGYVDTHFWQRFGAAILISVIDGAIQTAVASQRSNSGGSAVIYNTQGTRDVVTEVLRSTVNIPPTVVKNQGERIQVFVARDLDFRTVYSLHARAAQ